jgi:hypothetical protein
VAATPDPKVIFMILIITLNLHDPDLNRFNYNIRSNSLGCESNCMVVS